MGTESFRQVSLRFATRRNSPPFYLINSCREISEAPPCHAFRDTVQLHASPAFFGRTVEILYGINALRFRIVTSVKMVASSVTFDAGGTPWENVLVDF